MNNAIFRPISKAAPWFRLGLSGALLALLACNGSDALKPLPGTPPAPAPAPAPLISSVAPADASTAVPVTAAPSAVFNQDMAPLGAGTFTLIHGATQVPGALSTSADLRTATFTPATSLVPGTVFTATITTGAKSAAGTALGASRSWSFTTAGTAILTPPRVSATAPAANASGVDPSVTILATFNKVMDPLTITSSSYTVLQGVTPVAGAITFGVDGATAAFAPSAPLAASTLYTVQLGTGIRDQGGLALSSPVSWTFTTAAANSLPPAVSLSAPGAGAAGVALNATVTATFNQAMDPLTLSTSSFTLAQGGTAVTGNVVYGPGTNAVFTPAAALAPSTLYTATLTTAVQDLLGDALAAPFVWTFTTGAAAASGPAAVNLGTAGNYAILAKSAISSVPPSVITGDIGVSPAAESFLTGFSLTADATNVFSTSPQIVGKAFAANDAVPTPTNLTTAVGNMQTAYTDAATRPTPDHLNLGSGNIGGLTLAPGLYLWTSSVTVPTNVTLNGGANDVWIFQTTGDLSVSPAKSIILSGGAQAKNIFWQIAGQATVGTGAHFEGIMLCKTQVTLQTGATMNGRILAQTLVALQQATVTQR